MNNYQVRVFLLVLLLSSGAVFIIQKIIPYAIIGWDESMYMLWIYKTALAVRALHFDQFISVISEQIRFPLLPTVAMGMFFSQIEFSLLSARFFGPALYICNGLLIYMITNMLIQATVRARSIATFIATALYAASPMMIIFHGLALREGIGLTFTLMTLYSQLHSIYHPKSRLGFVTGLLLFCLFLVRYHYGMYAATALLFEYVVISLKRGFTSQHSLVMLFPVLVCSVFSALYALVFQITPESFVASVADYSYITRDVWTYSQKALFYPYAFIKLYSLDIWLGFVTLVGVLVSQLSSYRTQTRLLFIVVCMNFALVSPWTNNLHDRYIFTSVPLLFILAAVGAQKFLQDLTIRQNSIFQLLGAAAVCLSIYQYASGVLNLPSHVYSIASYTLRFPVFSEYTFSDKELPQDVFNDILNVTKREPVRIVGRANEFSPQLFELTKLFKRIPQYTGEKIDYPYVATIEILQDSPYHHRDYQVYNQRDSMEYIKKIREDPNLSVISEVVYSHLKVRMTLYKDKSRLDTPRST